MKVYQIKVVGQSAVFNSHFRCSSGKVYKHQPTQEQIDAFVEACRDDSYLDFLDPNDKDVEVKILELELVDD